MEWWNTVIWSWHNMELTNGKLIILIPFLIIFLLSMLVLIKMFFVAPHTKELTLIVELHEVLDRAFFDGKIEKDFWLVVKSEMSIGKLLIPMWKWAWFPWKWTTKQMFVKYGYEALINLTKMIQDL